MAKGKENYLLEAKTVDVAIRTQFPDALFLRKKPLNF